MDRDIGSQKSRRKVTSDKRFTASDPHGSNLEDGTGRVTASQKRRTSVNLRTEASRALHSATMDQSRSRSKKNSTRKRLLNGTELEIGHLENRKLNSNSTSPLHKKVRKSHSSQIDRTGRASAAPVSLVEMPEISPQHASSRMEEHELPEHDLEIREEVDNERNMFELSYAKEHGNLKKAQKTAFTGFGSERDLQKDRTPVDETEESHDDVSDSDSLFLLDVANSNAAEEGRDKWEESSDFDGESDPLLAVVKAQKERMLNQDEMRERMMANSRYTRNQIRSRKLLTSNLKENWIQEYASKPASFFTSKEAQLQVKQNKVQSLSGRERASPYKGISVHELNNRDMKFCYDRTFRGRLNHDHIENETYNQFRTVMGQVAHASISLNKLKLKILWKTASSSRLLQTWHSFMRLCRISAKHLLKQQS